MNKFLILAAGLAYGYIAGNPALRHGAIAHIKKLPGMAIDGLNRRGGAYVPDPVEPVEEPEEQEV